MTVMQFYLFNFISFKCAKQKDEIVNTGKKKHL